MLFLSIMVEFILIKIQKDPFS
jgi:hypothetical protein